ncbi:hypothetical protein [Cryobacterium melibiosiphilum]|uniref:hypothetical protein n=1 Tax=Cryobacterium melibiosiphilum TaxID=995039 RepID=UPI0011C21F2B|nr:hypothetical protein [Cryobacterium melibiosiphilum]
MGVRESWPHSLVAANIFRETHNGQEFGLERRLLLIRKKFVAVIGVIFLLSVASSAAQAQESGISGGAVAEVEGGQGVGIKLLDMPESTQSDPRTRTYIVDQVGPGTVLERRVQIQNNSTSDKVVYVYVSSATIQDGNFVGDSSSSQNELTTWTTLEQSQLKMPSGSEVDVLATISVPSDASEGEQYGAIWAEVRSAPLAGSSIVQASRAGVRIYLSVDEGNGTPADFAVGSLTPSRDAEGLPTLSALAENTGGRAIDISGELNLANGPAGLSAGPFTVQQATTLAPGDSGEVVFTLSDELPNGPWDATLSLKSGLVEREVTATITFPDAGVGETVAPNEAPVLLITLVSSGVLLLLIAAGTLIVLRRRRKTATPAVETAHADASV